LIVYFVYYKEGGKKQQRERRNLHILLFNNIFQKTQTFTHKTIPLEGETRDKRKQ